MHMVEEIWQDGIHFEVQLCILYFLLTCDKRFFSSCIYVHGITSFKMLNDVVLCDATN